MKKCLVFLLAIVVLVSFAACAAPSDSELPEETASPSGSISPEPSADGQKPMAGFVLLGINEFFQAMGETFVEVMSGAGWEASYADGKFDPTVQMELVENYIAMGADVIVIFPTVGDALTAAAETAMDAGVIVITMVNPTGVYDACMMSDPALIGKGICEMAAQWVEQAYPDAEDKSIGVAVLTHMADENGLLAHEALLEVEDYSDKFQFIRAYDLPEESAEAGMTAAENLHTTNPEIKVFLCSDAVSAIGINNYFTGISAPVDDVSGLAVFGGHQGNGEIYTAIQNSGNGTSMYRGVCIAAGIVATCEEILELSEGLHSGTMSAPVDRVAKVEKITVENVEAYL